MKRIHREPLYSSSESDVFLQQSLHEGTFIFIFIGFIKNSYTVINIKQFFSNTLKDC